jgi:cell wall-associated NlpC family hydrolase
MSGITLTTVAAVVVQLFGATAAQAASSWRAGEHGSGVPQTPAVITASERAARPSTTWQDLNANDAWARRAINHVAGTYDWMRDFRPDPDGNWSFRPDRYETRKHWARALVRAFAPGEEPDRAVTFADLDPSRPFYRWAAVAVQHGWMVRGPGGRFDPHAPVTARAVHRSLVFALGMRGTAADLDRLATRGGRRFDVPTSFGVNLLAMRLGLRFNNKVDEAQDVDPRDRLVRKQAAWSLFRATTLSGSAITTLREQYDGIVLPRMSAARRSIVGWGVRYIGYPYIWGGEWGFDRPEPPAFGSQPGPGFDCSGLTWWAVRRDDGGAWEISPPRPHEGWPLPQRTSAEMSRLTKTRLPYRDLLPGDLMFYDGDRDGRVDHVDVYVGNGFALDSSSGVGGVTLMWVQSGWYRDHFVHGRRVLPKPKP